MKKLNNKYQPQTFENDIYQQWLKEDLFKPSGNRKAKPYAIILPPPNITGKLHLGHAWDTTIQDTLIRFKRMQGYDTLYLPGMDHAGIATQAKIEKELAKQGKTRKQLGRTKFLQETWRWQKEYASIIRQQWAKLGLSLDYSRERFTLDERASKAIRKAFTKLYHDGLIYRGKYLINWDPQLQTTLSDIEIIHKETKGTMYYIKYPLLNSNKYLTIATTRPETMFGDTALAFAPSDKRYQALKGKTALSPLDKRHLPIISDYAIDKDLGTGIEKITPAHAFDDFEIGQRHQLPSINTINADGTMNNNAGKYAGLDRFECRKQIIADLKANGYLLKAETITHTIGYSERSNAIIEPRLSTQWFIKMKPLAKLALANQASKNKINFIPARFENNFNQWMANIHDWAISRQLWWGHRIPAWYNKQTGKIYVGEKAPKDIENWEQDPDVLDTWFSSSLWAFLPLGWFEKDNADFKRYFPTNALITGYDILPFWVSRMICQSLYFTKQSPFKDAIFHGLIRDQQGRKMSKSLGNGIDPMDLIKQYGADTLRWYLLSNTTLGQDSRYNPKKLTASWSFINKLWNAARFILLNLSDNCDPKAKPDITKFDLADQWIFSRLNYTINKTIKLLNSYQFSEAEQELTKFIKDEFCNWYLELAKIALNSNNQIKIRQKQINLRYLLDQILRLLHPIIPFITEKLWQTIPHTGKSIMIATYPTKNDEFTNQTAEKQMLTLIQIITAGRDFRNKRQIALSKPITLMIKADNNETALIKDNKSYLNNLLNLSQLTLLKTNILPKGCQIITLAHAQLCFPLADIINTKKELAKLTKQKEKLLDQINHIKQKLNSQGFLQKAPKPIIKKQQDRLTNIQSQLTLINQQLKELNI